MTASSAPSEQILLTAQPRFVAKSILQPTSAPPRSELIDSLLKFALDARHRVSFQPVDPPNDPVRVDWSASFTIPRCITATLVLLAGGEEELIEYITHSRALSQLTDDGWMVNSWGRADSRSFRVFRI